MKIDYSRLKLICESRGISMKQAAFMCDVTYSNFRSVVVYSHNPSTDFIVKICYGLGIRPSSFVKFDFEYPVIGKLYGTNEAIKPCTLTYNPLRELLIYNLLNKKHPNSDTELFSLLGNYSAMSDDVKQKVIHTALSARKIDYDADNLKKKDGLSVSLRTSFFNNRPVKMWIVYDICKILQCSIDNVLYFKCKDE